jgi:hypothetical protein
VTESSNGFKDVLCATHLGDQGLEGEPDLFCWNADGWFFAETKWKDKVTDHQPRWVNICRAAPGSRRTFDATASNEGGADPKARLQLARCSLSMTTHVSKYRSRECSSKK